MAATREESFKDYLSKNYGNGGDRLYETMTEEELREEFETKADMKEQIGLMLERELDHRWGEDTDPEVAAYDRFIQKWID